MHESPTGEQREIEMDRERLPWPIIYVVVLAAALDAGFTLLGQPVGYWYDHGMVREAAPHARFLLKASPVCFMAGCILEWVLLAVALRKLPILYAVMLSVFLGAAHLVGSSSWVEPFFRESVHVNQGFTYYLTFLFICAQCSLSGYVVHFTLTRGRSAPDTARKTAIVMTVAFLVLAIGIDFSFFLSRQLAFRKAVLSLEEGASDEEVRKVLYSLPHGVAMIPVEELLAIARSEREWKARTASIRRLRARIKEPGVLKGLMVLLEDRNLVVRQRAMNALQELDAEEVSEESKKAIGKYCEDQDVDVALFANIVLWRLGEKDALPRLFEMLPRTNDYVHRVMIAHYVRQLDDSIDEEELLDRDGEALADRWSTWWEDRKYVVSWDSEKKKFVMEKE